jgi:hypothetical protein
VAERQRRSNDGEAPVDGDEVPVILQLEEGKGGCEARLQRGTVAARTELTGGRGTGRRWCYVQKSGGSRDFRWAGVDGKPRGEKGRGCSRGRGEKKWGEGEEGGWVGCPALTGNGPTVLQILSGGFITQFLSLPHHQLWR